MANRTNRELWADVGGNLPSVGGGASAAPSSSRSPAPAPNDAFAFDVGKVRYGVSLERSVGLSERELALYAAVPRVVLEQAELYFETGEASSFAQMRRLIGQHLREDVPEVLLRYHMSLHYDRLVDARREFLASLQAAHKRRLLRSAERPEDMAYQRIAGSLTAILEGVASRVESGEQAVNIGGITQMIRATKMLREMDPAASKSALSDRVEAEREVAAVRAGHEERALKEQMRLARDFRATEEDVSVDDLEAMTARTVERIHGEAEGER